MPLNQLVAYKIIWLEHLTVNQRVLGSSPRGGASVTATLHILKAHHNRWVFSWCLYKSNLFKS